MDKKHEANQSRRRYAVGALKRIPVHAIWSGLVDVLKPEILQRRTTAHTRKGSTTAWLDGLRGVAALCVCITHLTAYTHKDLELCYGAERGALEGGGLNTSPAAWPIVRIPFTGGHFSVTVFFIISGYVVPRRLISLLHEGRKDDFVEAMNSAVFRRPGRLYLPVVWSTFFFAMVCWHLLGIEVPFPPHEKYLFPELYAWWLDMMKFFYYHREKMLFSLYNFHTWTIPVELRGSMFIFVWLFATHQMRTRPRILLTLGVLAYLVFGAHGAWYGCFFAGMLTAELDLLHAEGDPVQLPWDRVAKWFRSRRRIRQILLHFTLVCALYLASQPSSDGLPREKVLGECTGWKILNWFIPSVYNDDTNSTYRWFWLFWASWLTVISVKEIAWVRAIFESSPAQYLGKHSFALYLVHGPLIGILGERLFYLTGVKSPSDLNSFVKFGALYNRWHDASWWLLPDGGPVAFEPNFLFCVAICIPFMLYGAEIGTRMFDLPSVKVSNWMYRKIKEMR